MKSRKATKYKSDENRLKQSKDRGHLELIGGTIFICMNIKIDRTVKDL